ncbi:MAG: cyclic nucleotide-binding domain-containing protein [Myxococcaceae bacterium]|nr:cyclic nucleotide-binding domain-containing protein [Myxococcaceae bacterium]MCI0673549.1 cyclic nucleotide-binding domain-containing protein [Myxococcaceae bacterium]
MSQSLRELGKDLVAERQHERALAFFAEAVRRAPADHRARMEAAQCLAAIGEQERAVTALHACAEGLLRRDYLLSAIAACRQALDHSAAERRVHETLARVHTRAARSASGRAQVPPPLPPETLFEGAVEDDLLGLSGEELTGRAIEVLGAPDVSAPSADPGARPPLPLFAELSREAFLALVARMDYRVVPEGQSICLQGEGGDRITMLVAGKAEVTRRSGGEEQTVGFLGGGSIFGELSLLTEAPASATVTAVLDTEVFELKREHLNAVAKVHPELPQALVDFAQGRMARHLMTTSPLFQEVRESERARLLQRFTFRALAPGERALREGEHVQGLFLVLAGELVVQKEDPAGGLVTLAVLHEGDAAGEIALLTGLRATATVVATRKTATAFLDRGAFGQLVAEFPGVRDYLQQLSDRRLKQIGEALRPAEIIDADELVVLPTEGG